MRVRKLERSQPVQTYTLRRLRPSSAWHGQVGAKTATEHIRAIGPSILREILRRGSGTVRGLSNRNARDEFPAILQQRLVALRGTALATGKGERASSESPNSDWSDNGL